MTIIHILHAQSDDLIGSLDNSGEFVFWDDTHVQSVEGVNTFTFKTRADVSISEHIESRSRMLIPHEEQGWQEFITHESETSSQRVKTVYAIGSETELDRMKIILPKTHTGLTAAQYVLLSTDDTEWDMGIIEFDGSLTLTFEEHLGAYSFLRQVATAFDMELRFRIEVSGSQITGRYVDLVKVIGEDRGKEIVGGKDLIGIEKMSRSGRMVTALMCLGPVKDDGTRLSVIVTNYTAFQLWNRRGKHLYDVYEPESDNQSMTVEQLEKLGTKELNKRVASAFEYVVTAEDLEEVYEHEKVRLGDTVRIKVTDFNPPLYAIARVIEFERAISSKAKKKYIIGEVYEVKSSGFSTLTEIRAMKERQEALETENASLMLMIAESQTEGDAM